MKNYQQARLNMVDTQIHPQGVVSEGVLDAFSAVPREYFVPEGMKACAYTDEDLEIAPGRFLMEPQLHARLLEAMDLGADEAVLDIASGSGYSSALLSKLCATVISVEDNSDLMSGAQVAWDKLDICTIVSVENALDKGAPDHAPYKAIFMNGAVSFVPPQILSQLDIGGRLACVICKNKEETGKAMLIERTDENIYAERILFDVFTPYLPGLEPKDEFKF